MLEYMYLYSGKWEQCMSVGKLATLSMYAFDNSEFHCVVCVHYRVLSFECSAYRREKSCLSSEEE